MNPLPLPVRVAAGLAATALERARQLPEQLAGLPVTMASQALQLSMRVQQTVTELAIKGDQALSSLHPVEDAPKWATFDEDETDQDYAVRRFTAEDDTEPAYPDGPDPWELETEALAEPHAEGEFDTDGPAPDGSATDGPATDSADTDGAPADEPEDTAAEDTEPAADDSAAEPPTAQPDYAFLSIPQLRARLRNYTVDQLEELLGYELAHQARPPYVGMLTRRISTVSEQ